MNFDLLKRLCETPGIPGYEDRLRAILREELQPLVDELDTDVMGNVVGIKRGRAPRVMVAAHMDEIGFMVRYVDKNGFLRLQPLGGFDARMLVAQRVLVHTRSGQTLRGALMASTKPTHVLTEEERNRAPKLEQLFVDLGLPGEEVQELVEVGDMVTMDRTTEQLGENIISKSLDDRLSVYVMLEALRAVRRHEAEIMAVATTQEEVGLRGATTAAFALEPQIGIALDITLALDIPGIEEHEAITCLGKGAAIKLMDSSVISHPKLVRHFREIAEREKIPYQLEILPRGGTDAGAIQRARAGVITMTLSVPVRYVHTVNEMAAISDIEAAVTLLARYLEEAHTGDYSF